MVPGIPLRVDRGNWDESVIARVYIMSWFFVNIHLIPKWPPFKYSFVPRPL